ncbi:alpha/beta hydrolase [Motiliproteus sp. MSK22-1]|uniref:alpha/beta hydrolase n=1 Tax=Motiliproteus sp. MSK22-1 TaxID=1897630 RepID=UPI000976688B|nr:alpha/beta fold hydrolase [Motiliproteus sp. MSK22-1]OMH30264.1 hypothetical protein BGP75_17890 [Motiliproteus sp. MSK22-1]
MFDSNPGSKDAKLAERIRYRRFEELGLTPYLEQRQIIDMGDLPIHCELYEYDVQAPTILFIPGIGTYSELYCELLARLSRQGFNLLAVDLRGHGYSGGDRGKYTVDQVVEDIQLVIDYVASHYQGPVGLFGCSIGARLALAVAEQDSRIKALLCHTLFLSEIPPDIWHALGWNSLQFANWFTPGMKVNFRTFVNVESLLKHNPMGQLADKDPLLVWDYPVSTLYSLYSKPSSVLRRKLDTPSAIIIGSNDDIIPLDYTQRLIRRSKHPFELIVIEGGSHMLPFDHIEDTLNATGQWFKQAFID